jgi:hypothetical protein
MLKTQNLIQSFSANLDLIQQLHKTLECIDGYCPLCDEDNIKISKFGNVIACESCMDKIKDRIVEDRGKRIYHEVLNEDLAIFYVNEHRIYIDFKKFQDAVDNRFGGDYKELLKSYNLATRAVLLPDKGMIDLVNKDTSNPKARLNQFITDFDGEFLSDKIALTIAPDPDGTIAILKVRGGGIVQHPLQGTAPNSPTKSQNVNRTVIPTNTTPKVAPPTTTKPTVKPPNDEEFYIGKNKLSVTFIDSDNLKYTFHVNGIMGGSKTEFYVNKTDYAKNGKYAVLYKVLENLKTLTANNVAMVYTIDVFGTSFECELDMYSMENSQGLYFKTREVSKILKVADFKINMLFYDAISTDLKTYIKKYLRDENKIPSNFQYNFANTKIGASFDHVKGTYFIYKFLENGKDFTLMSGKDFTLMIDRDEIKGIPLKDEQFVASILQKNINLVDKDAQVAYSIRIPLGGTRDVVYKVELLPDSVFVGDLQYLATSQDDGSSVAFVAPSINNVEAFLIKELTKYTMAKIEGEKIGDISKKVVTKKGSTDKAVLLSRIGKYIEAQFMGADYSIKSIVSPEFTVDNSNNTIKDITLTITDEVGNTSNGDLKEYYTAYKDKIAKVLSRYKADILDNGIDDSGNAFVVAKVSDLSFIKWVVKEFALDEAMGWCARKDNPKLSMLFESVKRR